MLENVRFLLIVLGAAVCAALVGPAEWERSSAVSRFLTQALVVVTPLTCAVTLNDGAGTSTISDAVEATFPRLGRASPPRSSTAPARSSPERWLVNVVAAAAAGCFGVAASCFFRLDDSAWPPVEPRVDVPAVGVTLDDTMAQAILLSCGVAAILAAVVALLDVTGQPASPARGATREDDLLAWRRPDLLIR